MTGDESGGKRRGYRRLLRAAYLLATGPSWAAVAKAIWNLARARTEERTDSAAISEAEVEGPTAEGSRPSGKSLQAQREVSDMGHLWVAFFGGGLFLGLVTLLAFLWGLQNVLGRPPDPPAFRAGAIAHAGDSATDMRFRSHAPGLFPDPSGDLKRFRAEQAARAPRYAWVDRRAGIVSIPIERAMQRIAEAGWPRWEFPGVKGGAAAQPVSPREAARDTGKANTQPGGQ